MELSEAVCPHCSGRPNYDEWEDCYICQRCYVLLLPEDMGMTRNLAAGIYHLGEKA